MPRYIDADALRASALKATKLSDFAFDNCFPYWQFAMCIKQAPTADVVPVVRCGECKNFKLYPDGEGTHYGQCLCWMVGGIDDDEYCSYGAKMEDKP